MRDKGTYVKKKFVVRIFVPLIFTKPDHLLNLEEFNVNIVSIVHAHLFIYIYIFIYNVLSTFFNIITSRNTGAVALIYLIFFI